jgi:hypothetical protein
MRLILLLRVLTLLHPRLSITFSFLLWVLGSFFAFIAYPLTVGVQTA